LLEQDLKFLRLFGDRANLCLNFIYTTFVSVSADLGFGVKTCECLIQIYYFTFLAYSCSGGRHETYKIWEYLII